MTDHPVTRRIYRGKRRQEQAAETRRLILAAARQLFIERGYSGTTIQSVADSAGVASETVYATFGSKRSILGRLVEIAEGGDDQPISLLERPAIQAVQQEPDQRRQIQLFAHIVREILERLSPIFEIASTAAKSEPEIAALLDRILEQRYQNLSTFIDGLAHLGPLRAGVDLLTAKDSLLAISSPELYRLLTVQRGWTHNQYEHWLEDTLAILLLPGEKPTHVDR